MNEKTRDLPGALERVYGEQIEPFDLEPGEHLGEEDFLEMGDLSVVRRLLEEGTVLLVLPSEVFVHFYPAGPEQVINAIHAAGFEGPFFESLGDELVAYEHLRIWRENTEKRTWIRSTSPLVVEYCRARHPELLPLMAPIASPPVALARYLKLEYGEDVPIAYAGLDAPGANGLEEFTAYISFAELGQLLEERGVTIDAQPQLLRLMPPERQRYISTPGGLPLPMLDEERASSRTFRKLRGLHTLTGLYRLLEEEHNLGFIDILPFEGALDHPSLGSPEELYWRRGILELAEPPRAEHPVIEAPPELDLSATYGPRPSALPQKEIDEVAQILEEVGARANGTFWRGDPRGFASYLTMAQSMIRGRPELAVGLFHMSRNYSRAVRDATHDALTDLYSYRALVQRVREEMGQANRAGSSLAMLFVDLDEFKPINDRFGHSTGNEVLRRVAEVLQNTIRSTDIAGRFGGDEFVLLLVNSDHHGAVRVAEQIRQRIAQIRVEVPEGEARTTASVGIAFHDGAERSLVSADDLFAEADASLYIAKAHGGNRVHPVVKESGGSPQ